MTHIYYSYIDEKRHDRLLNEFLSEFPTDYQNKILKYKRWQDAQLSLVGRLLLKYGLKQFDKNLDSKNLFFNLYSKPYLKSTSIQFNVSHSGNIVVCAVSDTCEIGIDIEKIKDIEIADFKGQMTTKEWGKVYNSENILPSFYNYWTQKESVLKACGSGISISLKSFEILHNATQINDLIFNLKEINLNRNYKCYLAFNGKIDFNIFGPQEINSQMLF